MKIPTCIFSNKCLLSALLGYESFLRLKVNQTSGKYTIWILIYVVKNSRTQIHLLGQYSEYGEFCTYMTDCFVLN